MSYDFYRIIHISFIALLLLSLGGLWAFYSVEAQKKDAVKKYLLLFHGISIMFILIAGFGLMARLQIKSFPLWIHIKLALWLLIAVAPFALRKGIKAPRLKLKSRIIWWGLAVLVFLAILTARLKFS